MAQKTPYDPEEGIIDLFDIVDDPEASPQPEPCGAVRVGGGAGTPFRNRRNGKRTPVTLSRGIHLKT